MLAETVATPLEEQINGVENMLYMSSQATSDGVLTLTVTFRIGTDVDLAQVQVQNRVSQALPRLPEEVRRWASPRSRARPTSRWSCTSSRRTTATTSIYLRNYAMLQVKDVLARIPGVGQVIVFGAGDYAMRVWLDPQQGGGARTCPPATSCTAIREQNVQVAAGVVGRPADAEARGLSAHA